MTCVRDHICSGPLTTTLEAWRGGSARDGDRFYTEVRNRLSGLLLRLGDDGEDFFHEAFASFVTTKARFQTVNGDAGIVAWFRCVMRRHAARQARQPEAALEHEPAVEARDVVEERAEVVHRIRRLRQLPERRVFRSVHVRRRFRQTVDHLEAVLVGGRDALADQAAIGRRVGWSPARMSQVVKRVRQAVGGGPQPRRTRTNRQQKKESTVDLRHTSGLRRRPVAEHGSVILSADGRLDAANELARQLLGGAIGLEPTSASFVALSAEDGRPFPREQWPPLLARDGVPTTVDDVLIERDGLRTRCRVSATPVFGTDGGVATIVMSLHDTDRVPEPEGAHMRMRRLRSLPSHSGRFARQLDDVLTPILAYASIVAERAPPEHAAALREIATLAHEAHGLSRQLAAIPGRERVPADQSPDLAPPIAEPRGGRETVLVADDDPSVRKVVSRVLQSYGYRVVTASSVAQVEEAVENLRIDLLLSSVELEGEGAHRIATRMSEIQPEMEVLYMSNYHSRTAEFVPHEGDVLDKPFGPTALAQAVRQRLDRRL